MATKKEKIGLYIKLDQQIYDSCKSEAQSSSRSMAKYIEYLVKKDAKQREIDNSRATNIGHQIQILCSKFDKAGLSDQQIKKLKFLLQRTRDPDQTDDVWQRLSVKQKQEFIKELKTRYDNHKNNRGKINEK